MTEHAGILGLGTALPEHTCSQDEALAMASATLATDRRQERLLRTLFRRSGVNRRYGVLPMNAYWSGRAKNGEDSRTADTAARMRQYAIHAPLLAETASRRALDDAGLGAGAITHLVTVSCTGFDAPGVDVGLIERLGLPATTERVHVGYMGCHGAINGLRVARGLVAADPTSRVLLCAVELCTLHFQNTWHDERIIGDALFADGAAAAVLGCGSTDEGIATLTATGSRLIPGSTNAMAWRIGGQGFEMTLTTSVAEHVEAHIAEWLDAWLDRHGLSRRDVSNWIVHPGGPRIVDAVQSALSLPGEACESSRQVLADCGNMSSPTVLFVLDRERRSPGPSVLLAFGPGLVAEAALLT